MKQKDPPVSTTESKAPKAPTIERIVRLQMLNRQSVYEYYKAQKNAGPNRGENTIMEMVFGALTSADAMALDGKEWRPL